MVHGPFMVRQNPSIGVCGKNLDPACILKYERRYHFDGQLWLKMVRSTICGPLFLPVHPRQNFYYGLEVF